MKTTTVSSKLNRLLCTYSQCSPQPTLEALETTDNTAHAHTHRQRDNYRGGTLQQRGRRGTRRVRDRDCRVHASVRTASAGHFAFRHARDAAEQDASAGRRKFEGDYFALSR